MERKTTPREMERFRELCSMCKGIFKAAKLLPCGHSYCMEPCLVDLIYKGFDEDCIICKQCYKVHYIPTNESNVSLGIQGFPNYTPNEILGVSIEQGTDMDVKITEMTVDNVHAYKVMGGDNSVVNFATTSDNWLSRIIGHSDWQALYLQFKRDHVLGTIPYRWEPKDYDWEYDCIQCTAYTECTLYDVCFEKLHIIIVDDPLFHSGSISGADKANIIKKLLGIDKEEPLMHTLGKRGISALIRETEDEWELIIPHVLLPNINIVQECPLARFKRHHMMPITHKWMYYDNSTAEDLHSTTVDDVIVEEEVWQEWKDDANHYARIPDLDISWICLRK